MLKGSIEERTLCADNGTVGFESHVLADNGHI